VVPPRLRAAKRTFVLLSQVLDVPVLAPGVRAVTGRPRAESRELDGMPVEVVVPRGTGPWPAWVFVNGAHPLRRREPIVQRVADGLARAGFVAVVPDLPGLGEGEITLGTLAATTKVTEWTASRDDVVGGRVALCGASTGASLALKVAARGELADTVALVASVSPFADLERMMCVATTGCYALDGDGESYEAAVLLRRVVARSLLATLPSSPERTELLELAGDVLRDDEDPIEALATADVDGLGSDTRAVVELLLNTDPARFREHYARLPAATHELCRAFTPLTDAGAVRARVELIVPPLDPYFPPGETRALAAALPNARLTVTSTLDHTRPTLSRKGMRDLGRFLGFVARSLGDP
jgi:acetyl esterase/lipase